MQAAHGQDEALSPPPPDNEMYPEVPSTDPLSV